MESNRDEADKCLELAMKFIKQGQKDKAEKFVRKAERLFPSQRIQEILNLVQQMNTNEEGEGGSRQESSKAPSSPSANDDENEASTSSVPKNFSQEQVEAVKKIRRSKNYYEILGVGKDFSDAELKKSYRKLALSFHPDKNKAPGAAEAFKAIGNAYAVLSEPEKKRQYDLYGEEEGSSSRGHRRTNRGGFYEYEDPSHGFQGDMTAEEIFNMFFGGGMPDGSVYTRRGGRWQRQGQNMGDQAGHSHSGTHRGEANSFSAIFQLVPILLLVVVSTLSSLMVADPLFSLDPSHKYTVQQTTHNLRVNYYVKQSFRTEFTGSKRKLEKQIEEEYIQHLRNSCFREKSYKENLLWQARYSGNNNLMKKAHNYPVPSCDKLEKVYSPAA